MGAREKFQRVVEVLEERGAVKISPAKAKAMAALMKERATEQPELRRWEHYHGNRFVVLEHDAFLGVHTLRLETQAERREAMTAALQLRIMRLEAEGKPVVEKKPAANEDRQDERRRSKIERGTEQPSWLRKGRSYRAG